MKKIITIVIISLVVLVLGCTLGNEIEKKENIENNNASQQPIWQTYRNERWGFEIKYPKFVTYSYYGYHYDWCLDEEDWCRENECNILKDKFIPLKVLNEGNTFYIIDSYHYQKGADNSCQKIETKISHIKKAKEYGGKPSPWKIEIVENINSDKDLENFLKQHYGESCGLAEKNKIDNLTYEVIISTDQEAGCWINYMTRVRYNPKRKLVAVWDIGQEPAFSYDRNNNGKIDDYEDVKNSEWCDYGMIDSFRFID